MQKTKATREDLVQEIEQLKNENKELTGLLHRCHQVSNASIPFLDIIPQMVSYTNKDLRYEYVNKAYEQNFNVRSHEIIGKTLMDFIGPEVLKKAEKHIRRVFQGEEVKYIEKFTYPNGMVKFINGHLLPNISKSGEVMGYWAILNDITEQKIAEDELRDSEEKYRNLFEAGSDAIFLVDEETLEIIDANHVAEQIYGYTKEELQGLKATDISAEPAETSDSIRNFAGHRSGKLAQKRKVRRYHRKKDGTVFPVEITANRLVLKGQKVNISAVRDITELVNMETSLKESEERFRLLVEAAPMSILALRNGKYIYGNPRSVEMLGYKSSSEIVGKNALDTIAPEFHEAVRQRMSNLKNDNANNPIELQLVRPDRKHSWAISTSVRVTMDGQPTTIIVGQDITERKRVELALQESERQKNLILNASTELIAFYDTNLRIIWTNKAAANSVDLSVEDLVGNYCYKVWHNRKTPCEHCPVLKSLVENIPCQAEKQTPDGRLWHIRGYPIFNDEGKIIALGEFGLDITKTKKAELALRESEERLRKAFDNELVAMAISRQNDGTYIEANPGFLKLTGYSSEEIIGHTSQELSFLTQETRQDLKQKLKKHKVLHNQELTFPTKSGNWRSILYSIGPITINGDPCLLATMVDITTRKDAETALRESETRYRKLMEEAPVGIALFVNNQLEMVNKKLLEILGYENFSAFRAKTIYDVVHPDDHDLVKARSKAIKKGTVKYPFSSHYRVIRNDGEILSVTEYVSEFTFSDKVYTQSIIQDITQIMEIERNKKEIANEAAYIERKMQLLKMVEMDLKAIIAANNYDISAFHSLFTIFKNELETDRHWQIFKDNFESLNRGFFERLLTLSPKLTQQDIKHCAYIKMNFETKQIATMFNVKPSSVQMSRVRLKKKLNLKPNEDLIQFIMRL